MPKTDVTENQKNEIRKKVQREFPDCKALQDLHYHRYIKEIEWKDMSADEIVRDIKEGAKSFKGKVKVT
ncbi:MAG: hypothetical protein AAB116_05085 [Candidatus Poribacteria bacterium]